MQDLPSPLESSDPNFPDVPLNGLDVKWSAEYNALQHDVVITYKLTATAAGVRIFQVHATNTRLSDFFPPEDIPTIRMIWEVAPDDGIRSVFGRLTDGKWVKADAGKRYRATIGGYCLVETKPTMFRLSHEYTFPGW